MEYLTQIVLEGRQAGVYVIFAMQRPDGEYIKTSLRDNFMMRLRRSFESTGYDMMFGDANKNQRIKNWTKLMGKVFGRVILFKESGEVLFALYST